MGTVSVYKSSAPSEAWTFSIASSNFNRAEAVVYKEMTTLVFGDSFTNSFFGLYIIIIKPDFGLSTRCTFILLSRSKLTKRTGSVVNSVLLKSFLRANRPHKLKVN